MHIKDLLAIYRKINTKPYDCLINAGVQDVTSKYNFGKDKVFYIPSCKRGMRLCNNPNGTYSIKMIDNFGPKARGEARYSEEYYGPYQYETSAIRACVNIARKYL